MCNAKLFSKSVRMHTRHFQSYFRMHELPIDTITAFSEYFSTVTKYLAEIFRFSVRTGERLQLQEMILNVLEFCSGKFTSQKFSCVRPSPPSRFPQGSACRFWRGGFGVQISAWRVQRGGFENETLLNQGLRRRHYL